MTTATQAHTINAQTAEMQDSCGRNTVLSLQLCQTTFNTGEDRERTTAPVPGAWQNGGEELTSNSLLLSYVGSNFRHYPH